MTIARGAVLGALLAVVAVVAIILLSSGDSEQYKLIFQNAGQLVKGDDVQIGGRRVGGVSDILLTNDNQAEVVVDVDKPYAPLHEGTTATIRLTSLSGVANRYIALVPGPNNAPKIPGGGQLGVEKTTSVVDLDQLFNTLDPRTRLGLQRYIQGSAAQYEGQGPNVNQSAKYFNPFLSTTDQLVKEIARDQGTLTRAIVAGASVTGAVAQRAPQLTSLVTNLNTTMGAIASQNASLSQALGVLPDTLREGNSTFVDLRATLDDLDPLLQASKPAAAVLPRFFSQLTPLLNESTPTFQNLSAIVHQPGPFNDATDATQHLPQLLQVGSKAFSSSITAMRKGQPVIDFLRPYSPDLVGWFRDFGQSAANYDANGHYARVMPIFGAFQYQARDDTLQPVPPSQRLAGLTSGFNRRCPGAASQPRPDGSNPFAPNGFDCNASDVLPGP
jgi:phospholipid/cholesterol/gamma-HCH transport system substrate-binding protein